MTAALVITRWPTLTAPTTGRRSATPMRLFVDELKRCGEQPFAGDLQHSGWSPATFAGGERALERVVRVHALGLDYDHGPEIDPIAATWSEFAGVVHTTRRHTPEAPRCRVILPLSRPVSIEEHARLWAWARARATALGHQLDEAPKDPSRFWYWPGSKTGHFELRELDAEPLDPDTIFRQLDEDAAEARPPLPHHRSQPNDDEHILERARRYVAKMPAAISGQHGHDTTYDVALVLVQGFALPEPTAFDLLREYNQRCEPPWSEKELEHKIAAAAKASRVASGWLREDDQREWRSYTSRAHESHVGEGSVSFVSADSDAWPDPIEPLGGLRPVPALTERLLPPVLCPWLADIAERTQAPPEFAAVGALVSLSSVVGRGVTVRPKQHDDWEVAPNLWGGVVGRPGVMKSPALRAAMAPVYRLAADATKEYQLLVKDAAVQDTLREARIRALKNDLNNAIRTQTGKKAKVLRLVPADETPASPAPEAEPKTDPEEIAAELTQEQNASAEPTERRFIVNDPTVEKLGEILNKNPRGLLLFRDELVGWLHALERSGHECDRAFYLESWAGNGGRYIYDRIARGTIAIESPCVSILGGIQPSPLGDHIRGAVRGGAGDDGLIQRFQLLVYPDVSGAWRNVDRWPDTDAKNRVFEVFKRLAEPDVAAAVGAHGDPDEPSGLPYLRFAPAALERFVAWRGELERHLRSGQEHPALDAHLSKFRSLVPSLALLFHLVAVDGRGGGGAISDAATELAIAWSVFLAEHARRIYGTVTEGAAHAAAMLASKIRAGKVAGPFRARDIYRHGWSGLTEPDDVAPAIEILIDCHWLQAGTATPDPVRGGRPTPQYRINPKVVRHA